MKSKLLFYIAIAFTLFLAGCTSAFNPDGSLNYAKLYALRYGVLVDANTGNFDLVMKPRDNEQAKLYMNIVEMCGLGYFIKDNVVYPTVHKFIMADGVIDRKEIYEVDNYNKCTKGYINSDYVRGVFI